jgi:crossover junction endodeoxyribonuclease RuvC
LFPRLRIFAKFCAVGISPQDFEKMRARLNGAKAQSSTARRSPAPVHAGIAPTTVSAHQIILGIDPSLRGTGYGVIQLAKPHPITLAHGTISCPAGWERSRCLLRILETIREQARLHRPTACAIEGLFYAQNLQTALIMGEARGASLAAAAEAGLEIFEIAPRKVKLAIVGYGAAQKHAVGKMVQRMLQLPEPPSADAADALALALAYAQETGRYNLAAPKKV